jgi:hypothetical protein
MSKIFHDHPLFNTPTPQQFDRSACRSKRRIINRATILAIGDSVSGTFGICKANFPGETGIRGRCQVPFLPLSERTETAGIPAQKPHPMYTPVLKT